MRLLAAIAVFACAAHPSVLDAQLLDRIAVTVGNQVITETAVILDLRVGAFLDRAALDLSAASKRRAAQRLADQILILREAAESHLALPTEEKAQSLLFQVKAEYGPPSEFQAALKKYGIEEKDVLAQLLSGLIGLTFTELRFSPGIQIPDDDLRAYYDKLDAQTKAGASFEESRDDIEQILKRQRVSDALDQWLGQARNAAKVNFHEQVFR